MKATTPWIGEAMALCLVLSLLVGSSCESVSFTDCAIRCAPDGDCPDGLSCRNGFCSRGRECEDSSAGAAGVTSNGGHGGTASNGDGGSTAGNDSTAGHGGAGVGGDSEPGGSGGEQTGAAGEAGGGGVTEPWSPLILSEVVLWLDAGFGVSTVGLSSNLRVTAWQDRSGKGNHAAQPMAAAQPRFSTEVVDGRPAVEFNGQLTYMSVPHSETLEPGWQDFTMQIVAAWTSSHVPSEQYWAYGALYNKQAPNPPYTGVAVWANDFVTFTGQLMFSLQAPTELVISSGPPLNNGDFRLYGARRFGTANGAGEIEVRINGVPSPSLRLSSPLHLGSGSPATIGGRESPMQQMVGAIAEIVFVRGTLSDEDLERLETYLNDKYSLW